MAIDPSLFERIAGRQPRPAPVGDGAVAVGDSAAVDSAAVDGAAVDGAGTAAESETPNGGAAGMRQPPTWANRGRRGAMRRPQAGDGAPDSDNRPRPPSRADAAMRRQQRTGRPAAIDPLKPLRRRLQRPLRRLRQIRRRRRLGVPAQPGAPSNRALATWRALVPAAGVDPFPARAPATNPPTTNPPTTNPPAGANPSAGTPAGSAPLANPATDRKSWGSWYRRRRCSALADRRYDLLPVLATLSPGDQLYSPPLFRSSMSLQGGLTAICWAIPVYDCSGSPTCSCRSSISPTVLVLTTANDLERSAAPCRGTPGVESGRCGVDRRDRVRRHGR